MAERPAQRTAIRLYQNHLLQISQILFTCYSNARGKIQDMVPSCHGWVFSIREESDGKIFHVTMSARMRCRCGILERWNVEHQFAEQMVQQVASRTYITGTMVDIVLRHIEIHEKEAQDKFDKHESQLPQNSETKRMAHTYFDIP